MSVINDEAERIAQETLISGAADEDISALRSTDVVYKSEAMPPGVEEAIALAESELAAVARGEATKPVISRIAEYTEAEAPVRSAPAPDAAGEENAPAEDVEAQKVEAHDNPDPMSTDDGPDDSQVYVASNRTEGDASWDRRASFDAVHTPERAAQSVGEIKQGVRKLAAFLRTEVSERWNGAKETPEGTTSAREKIDAACEKAQRLLDEMSRLRDDARVARDEADSARHEAKLFREDTRRAKQRAETSAAAADLAAN